MVAEPDVTPRLGPGTLVLGIGLGVTTIPDLLAAAARARSLAVVVRGPADDDAGIDLAAAARAAGVGLFVLDPATPWTDLLTLATDAAQERGFDAEEADDGVPLGDLPALADAIADMVGGPVTLEDAEFRVLAYSRFVGIMDPGRATAILGRRMPPEWSEHLDRTGALEQLRSTNEVIDVIDGPGNANRRLIVAVREGAARPLGFIWVAEAAGPLPAHAVETLRRIVPIAVPHYRRHHELLSAQHRHRQQLVRALLQGHGPLQRYADELELPRDEPLVVLAVTAATERDLPPRTWERIVDHVALSCGARRWDAAVTRIGRTVFAIAHLSRGGHTDAVSRLAHDIVLRSAPATGEQLCAASSPPAIGARALPGRRAEAERALAICRSRGTQGFVHYDDVRAEVIVDQATAALRSRPDLRLPGLDRLRVEDARGRGGGQLLITLGAYLESGGAIPATASCLGLHPTTVRYRLDRISSLTGFDLDDSTTRLACALELRATESGGDALTP
ncbi:PucR family transcriptional regulator [Pseudonocardia sichuanensis]